MVVGERLTFTLRGGVPWGFRLQGGGNFPLEVAKIRKNSHASEAGLREGDVVLSINGHVVAGHTHQSAMDVVDMASGSLVFEVARSGQGPSMPLDPQRHPRIIPMVAGQENAGPGVVTSAHADYSLSSGDTRTDFHTDEYVMRTDDGRKVTKTVTQRTTRRFSGSSGPSPAASYSSIPSGEHSSRSLGRPHGVWVPPSQRTGGSNLYKSQSLLDVHFGHRTSSPLSSSPRSLSPKPNRPRARSGSVQSSSRASKENHDPFMEQEQAKWRANHTQEVTPPMKFTNIGTNKNVPTKFNDPNYPMFDVPKVNKAIWTPPVINEPGAMLSPSKKRGPPVPPKPMSPNPSPIPFDQAERPVAGTHFHRPGMIRPPPQLNTLPAPPPPPMPLLPQGSTPKFNVVSFESLKNRPGREGGYDEPDSPSRRPDHLPVFGPKVVFDDEGGDSISDISRRKLFADSAFYDDSTHRYPTIDEQMSMCKKIAQSLTSYANKRARGARMFEKRKRRSNKWIHDYGTEFSSSTGDVADLDELDSELHYVDGGNKPLFSFRIPKVAGQVTDGERMSMSKSEFERLRLVAPKVDHHSVSPNTCFSIAADLHKGGKNKGAKLFAKRQQRVEKFVIDETNVMHSPVSPSTKLDFYVQNAQTQPVQKNPWNAAASGDVNRAFNRNAPSHMPPVPVPRHDLKADSQMTVLGGPNYNKKARGWGGSGAGIQQHSYYRESFDPQTGTSRKEWYQQQHNDTFDPEDPPKQFDQYGNYNRRMKAWPETEDTPQPPQVEYGDYNRRTKPFQESEPRYEQPSETKVEFGDYNRKIKGFQESESKQEAPRVDFGDYNRRIRAFPGAPEHNTSTSRTVKSSYNVQTNYNTFPRAAGSSRQYQEIPSCDL
ncbi:uncharacterized protein LOC128207861 isoform X1 [Mya arenaria]|uniref:uncharacterized protein LOC128207861 isoform X1 n=1 Tax=Mya arenaria TaxID=6604 RepID=UPI0022DF814E|nr:uncharacterized protein LOC128207861 isoform X1 [Mya arenaria]